MSPLLSGQPDPDQKQIILDPGKSSGSLRIRIRNTAEGLYQIGISGTGITVFHPLGLHMYTCSPF